MGINPVLERHLLQARRELLAQRASLDEDIHQIDVLLRSDSGVVAVEAKSTQLTERGDTSSSTDPSANQTRVAQRGTRGIEVRDPDGLRTVDDYKRKAYQYNRVADLYEGGSMRLAILNYLTQAGEPMTTQHIAKDLAEQHDWAESSIRSLLSRLAKDEVIVLVRRGVYATWDTAPNVVQVDLSSTLDEESDDEEAPDSEEALMPLR
ncbi:BlaI/MecI/CopY family transcriptional regulator [Mycobacterium paraterrae]|uniref:BlaI/MecI/CopY family transcriptional regulator n=1 Tax=Mycobacterium paraterrae TaxID=577492 RepID=A0ABY3VSF6_9MYCO|nr:BlaI/MecI/CopY family transcriptional regulator [Mycobacterium paraterrae]UMB70128.1 BlaI/MecI/CopY family transcriptional regulator [Mycobacterium paraterrae]